MPTEYVNCFHFDEERWDALWNETAAPVMEEMIGLKKMNDSDLPNWIKDRLNTIVSVVFSGIEHQLAGLPDQLDAILCDCLEEERSKTS